MKGATVGLLALIPAVSLVLSAVARLGDGRPVVGVIETLRLTAIFAGLPAIVTAGGVGRLTAEASLDGGRPRAALVGARALAFAGAALIVIAALAASVIPTSRIEWVGLAAVGAIAGAAAGALVGLACGGPLPSMRELGVWPGDVNLTEAVERVMTRAIGRSRDTDPPPAAQRDEPPP